MSHWLRSVALVGIPNSGKSSLFNRLTGARQKVANYAGVTVDCREGQVAHEGLAWRLLDLPGLYGLRHARAEELVTRRVVDDMPAAQVDVVACTVDAANPELGLTLALELTDRGKRIVVVLTAGDLVDDRVLAAGVASLEKALGVPVIATSAFRSDGARGLLERLAELARAPGMPWPPANRRSDAARRHRARQLATEAFGIATRSTLGTRLDRLALHPVAGPLILLAVLFLVFQAVYRLAEYPSAAIEAGIALLGGALQHALGPGALRDLLIDGVLAGAGSVLVFLPPVLILFAFLIVLEESGYLPRAAFVLDPPMARLGLGGQSFIPLLSSFACAVPGILATRTIADARHRRATMLLAPLMTCSARLPVYTLLIGAFVPQRTLGPGLDLQGLVLFSLYAAGVGSAVALAACARLWQRAEPAGLLMELPAWRRPAWRNVWLGLRERALVFLRRVGGMLMALSVVMWALTRFPGPDLQHSIAGHLGHALLPLLAPLGFNWEISLALVPGLAAREAAVAALGTVYAASGEPLLAATLAQRWSTATALALLAWYVFAPQCLSTLVVLRREANGWTLPLAITAGYFALAWLAAFATYRIANVWIAAT